MENPNENQSFKSTLGDIRSWIEPYILKAFRNATTSLTWVEVDRATNWKRILPIPKIDPSEFELSSQIGPYLRFETKSIETLTQERNQKWAADAEYWFLQSKLTIAHKKAQLKRQFEKGLDMWKRRRPEITLTLDDLVDEWSSHNKYMTIMQLSYLTITPKITKPFFDQLAKKLETESGLPSGSLALDTPGSLARKKKDDLTSREKMLIHCYEQGEVINKGEPNYKHYITFASPRKRRGYPGSSLMKAKGLIKSIVKILPYLTKEAKQQANSELLTIEANFSDQVATK